MAATFDRVGQREGSVTARGSASSTDRGGGGAIRSERTSLVIGRTLDSVGSITWTGEATAGAVTSAVDEADALSMPIERLGLGNDDARPLSTVMLIVSERPALPAPS
jgi:hypothetical protein